MSNAVNQYFNDVERLIVFAVSAKRMDGYGQLFGSRRSLAAKQGVWMQLRQLLQTRNENYLTEIADRQSACADSFAEVSGEYAIARADMQTLRLFEEIGTASEIAAQMADRIVTWLYADSGYWAHAFPVLTSIDDLRELRLALEWSDAKFPLSGEQSDELLAALDEQRSIVLRKSIGVETVDPTEATMAVGKEIAELFRTSRGGAPDTKHLAKTLAKLPKALRRKSGPHSNSAWIYDREAAIKLIQNEKRAWKLIGN